MLSLKRTQTIDKKVVMPVGICCRGSSTISTRSSKIEREIIIIGVMNALKCTSIGV